MKVLEYNGTVGGERRPLYFLAAFGQEIKTARIISFGACNFACPYCKRDGAFRADDGSIISAVDADLAVLYGAVDDAVENGEVVRLSGGDPVMFPAESLALARRSAERGAKISIAHNGSSPAFVRRLLPFLHSAAIDLKAGPHDLGKVAGIGHHVGEKMFYRSLEVQRTLANAGVFVDVRTPIFGTTTLDDMLVLAEHVASAAGPTTFWTWRLYKPVAGCDWLPPARENVVWMIGEGALDLPDLKIGMRAKWEPSGFLYF